MAALHTAKPATALADDGLANSVHAGGLNTSEDTEHSPETQRLLVELRAEHRRLRFALVRIEIVGLALANGVFTPDIAAELSGISVWPQGLIDAAVEWRAERDRRDPLPRRGPDSSTSDFLTRVMADDPPRKQFRRSA